MNRHIELPSIPNRYVLNPARGAFSLVIPEATTNLITNPSFETNTTSWLATGSTIGRSTLQQRYGAYSLEVAAGTGVNAGVSYTTLSLTSGTTYTGSAWVYAPAGTPLKIFFATTGNVSLMETGFIATGRWQRVSVSYTETSTSTRRLLIAKDGGTRAVTFYIDGIQVEAKAYPTTYCDGDQAGFVPNQFPPAYLWTGTDHASTSTRSAQTRAGGRVVNLDIYGYRVIGHVGLGIGPTNNIILPYGQFDGGQYQQTVIESRQFTIIGRFDAATPAQLARLRSALYSDLALDLTNLDQPVLLLYQSYDDRVPTGDEVRIVALYQHGLEGTTNNRYAEDATISFVMPDPFLSTGSFGSAIGVALPVSNANYIIKRSNTGLWSALSTGLNERANDIVIASDGSVYVGGNFTTAGGGAANYIAKWDGSAWSTLSTGMNGNVLCLAIGPDGSLYAGGAFTTAGGGAANRIAKWDGSAWSALGTGLDAQCNDIVIGPDGSLYATGIFANAGGGAAARIAKWDGSAWSALSTGLSNVGATLVFGLDGSLYVGGLFGTAGGTTVNGIAKWDGSAFSALGSGMNVNSVLASTVAPDGTLYVIGQFTAAGGVSARYIAKWNGSSWFALGNGLAASTVLALLARRDGTVLIGESPLGALSATDDLSIWNGSTYVLVDVDLPTSTPNPRSFAEAPDGTIYIGFTASGSASAITNSTLTYLGTVRTYPRIMFVGPTSGTARIYGVSNFTTGKNLYFDLQISAGETIIADLSPDSLSLVSDFRGNLLSAILGGSNRSEMYALPGDNTWGVLATDSTITATFSWPIRIMSVDDVTY